MKRAISGIMASALFTIGLFVFGATTTSAQAKYCNDRSNQVRYDRRGGNARYQQASNQRNRSNRNYYGKQPNVYDRHRKAVNLSVGTAGGALLGAAIGGKRGALIGAGAGLATGAIVTANQKPRNYRRY
jgi:hypothetical protein